MKNLPDITRSFFGWREMLQLRRGVLACYQQWREDYGEALQVRLGPVRNVVFYSPAAVAQVLKHKASHFRRFPHTLRVLAQWNGNSVLILEGEPWLRQRRLLAPAFRPQQLSHYCENLMGAIEAIGCGDFELAPAMVRLALRMLCATLFGLKDEDSGLGDSLNDLAEIGQTEFFLPWPVPTWLPIPFARRKKRAIAALRGFVEHLIEQRSRMPAATDLLSLLLAASDEGGKLTPVQLRDEVMTLMLAGHDTTAAGLSWLLFLLATHPQVAEQVAHEGRALPARPSVADLAGLRYTEQVVKETLRLYPPAPAMFLRQALEEVEIDGFRIPRGTLIHLPAMTIQRDPRFFPDPLRFDPDRFSPELTKLRPEFSYFPFGGGPRVCLGQPFALLEMTLTAAVLMRRYTVSLRCDQVDPPVHLRVSLWPGCPLRVRLEPRQG